MPSYYFSIEYREIIQFVRRINSFDNFDILARNPSVFASISTLIVSQHYLMENILGAAPGNFSFAYEQYMKATSLYEISLADHNYLYGLNQKGGSGILQRLTVEYGVLAPAIAILYFCRKSLIYDYRVLIVVLILFGRNENIFKPDLLLFLFFVNFFHTEKIRQRMTGRKLSKDFHHQRIKIISVC